MIASLLNFLRGKRDNNLFQLAHFDYVTGLPNRLSFFNDMNNLVARVDRSRGNFSLLFFDLDNFKQVNDTLGHDIGDDVLKIISNRLKVELRKTDLIYRLGGDEFVVVVENVSNPKTVAQIAEKIIETCSKQIDINDKNSVNISSSVGICFYPSDGDSIKDIQRKADTAMYIAKKKGKAFQFYTGEVHEKVMEKMRIENSIKKDLSNGREGFKIMYQPQINIKTGKVVGFEALLRWSDKDLGFIDTGKLISICEESNIIVDIDRFVLQQACIDINKINSELGTRLYVSVNFSPKYLYSKEVVRDVMNIIERTYTPPQNIEIEITERTVMSDMDTAELNINDLSKEGIKVAIDDFGIGASSLNYLKKFKVNKLKIDRTFIRDIMHNEDDKKIVNAILALAYHFDLECTAEGVETKNQLNFLKASGCDLVQGYYYSRALPIEDLISLLKKSKERIRQKTEEQVMILTKYKSEITGE